MAKIIPTIQSEKPALLEKITKFSSYPPDVVLKNTMRAGFNCSFTI